MKKAPVILISGGTQERGSEMSDFSVNVSMNYPLAIAAAGGMPWLLPCLPVAGFVAELVRRADGVVLSGGDDVHPALYGRETLAPGLAKTVHPAAPERDLFELLLIQEVVRQRKPLLAICRGQQILNVALGGSLVADIAQERPGSLNHCRLKRKHEVVHEVKVAIGSLLAGVTGTDRLGVNSTHHQAVAKIAKPLRAIAVSIDGIIEGLEWDPGGGHLLPWLLAVQFHPERLFARYAEHLEILRSFIRACRRNRK